MNCSTAYARLFLRYSQLPVAVLLSATELTADDLERLQFIDAEDHLAIVRALNANSNDPAWAARTGDKFSVSAHGPIGFAALSAPTLGEALQTMVDYHQVRTNTFAASLDMLPTLCRYRMWDLTHDEEYAQVLSESTVRILQSLLEVILGDVGVPEFAVHFEFSKPDYHRELEIIYGAPCFFESSFTGFEIPIALCQEKSPLHDEATYRSNVARCRGILEDLKRLAGARASVHNYLAQHFDEVAAGAHAEPPPELTELARRMHVTPRTLIRHLKQDDTTYKSILESLRHEYAKRLLRQDDLSVSAISDMLGYSDPANFGRAFRGWSGRSPSVWRENVRTSG